MLFSPQLTPTEDAFAKTVFSKFVDDHGSEYKTNTKLVKAFLDMEHELTTDDLVDVLGISQKNAHRYLVSGKKGKNEESL